MESTPRENSDDGESLPLAVVAEHRDSPQEATGNFPNSSWNVNYKRDPCTLSCTGCGTDSMDTRIKLDVKTVMDLDTLIKTYGDDYMSLDLSRFDIGLHLNILALRRRAGVMPPGFDAILEKYPKVERLLNDIKVIRMSQQSKEDSGSRRGRKRQRETSPQLQRATPPLPSIDSSRT